MFLRVLLPVEIGDQRRVVPLALAVAQRFGLPVEEVGGGTAEVVDIAMASSGLICVADSHHLGRLALASQLITRAVTPVLVAGPHVAVSGPLPFDQLVVCMAGDDFTSRLGKAAASWAQRAGATAWLVEVVGSPSHIVPRDSVDAAPVRRLASDLHRLGVDAPWDVVHDHHFAEAALRVAGELPLAVLAVPRADHDRAIARRADRTLRLARRAHVPVLVVPPGGQTNRRQRRWAYAA